RSSVSHHSRHSASSRSTRSSSTESGGASDASPHPPSPPPPSSVSKPVVKNVPAVTAKPAAAPVVQAPRSRSSSVRSGSSSSATDTDTDTGSGSGSGSDRSGSDSDSDSGGETRYDVPPAVAKLTPVGGTGRTLFYMHLRFALRVCCFLLSDDWICSVE